MKINATTRLLAANLPPELLAISNNTYFRKDLARYLIRFGIDLNTAKFEKLSNEDALRALKSSKGLGVLFCFDTNNYRNKVDCTVIGMVKTSISRYSMLNVISTYYKNSNSPSTIIKQCNTVYFVKGNEANLSRLSEQRDSRREQYQFETIDPAKENQKRYQKQLAERHQQKAIANAKELIKLVKNAASSLIQDYDFTKSYNLKSLNQCFKPLEDYLEKEIFSDYRVSFYDAAITANGDVSPEKDSYEINFLAALDMNKIRNDLSRF